MADFVRGQMMADLTGRKYKLVGADEAPYQHLYRLQCIETGANVLVSSYELQHYYKTV